MILIGGTSGCGKSSLALELQSKLNGWREWRIISTDEVRDEIRVEHPASHFIWRSTYNITDQLYDGTDSSKTKVLGGFQSQVSLVEEKLNEKLGLAINSRQNALIVEGVHVTPDFCLDIRSKWPFRTLPVFLNISDDSEHKHRFELRGPKPSASNAQTSDPTIGKYFRYFNNIKCISSYLISEATKNNILVVENSVLEDSVQLVLHAILSILSPNETN